MLRAAVPKDLVAVPLERASAKERAGWSGRGDVVRRRSRTLQRVMGARDVTAIDSFAFLFYSFSVGVHFSVRFGLCEQVSVGGHTTEDFCAAEGGDSCVTWTCLEHSIW